MRLVTTAFRDATLPRAVCLAVVLLTGRDVVAQSHDTPAPVAAAVKTVGSEHATPAKSAVAETAAAASPPPTGHDVDPPRVAKGAARAAAARRAAASVSATGRGRRRVASARRAPLDVVPAPPAAVRWKVTWPAPAEGVTLSWPEQGGEPRALNSSQVVRQIP